MNNFLYHFSLFSILVRRIATAFILFVVVPVDAADTVGEALKEPQKSAVVR